jgi:hypothetical protein
MERTLGLKDVVLSFDAVHRIRLEGSTATKLTFETTDNRETFTFEDLQDRFDAIVQHFHAGHQEQAAAPDSVDAEVEAILSLWDAALEEGATQVMEAHLAVQVHGRIDATRGVMVQTSDEVRFLPAGGPTGTASETVHPVPRILRNYSGKGARSTEVCFSVSGESYRYLPVEGADFVRRFWDRCRSPSRIFHLDAPSRRAVMRVLGPSRFIRISGTHGSALAAQHLEEGGRTWCAHLEECATVPDNGQRMSVDVGQPEGVYRFDAEVVDVDVEGQRVYLERPSTIRVYNQRRSYRVTVDLPARVRIDNRHSPLLIADSLMGEDFLPPIDSALSLSDLSLGGCAASGTADLPAGASGEMEVDLDGNTPLRVTGRVLRNDAMDDSGALRRFGIRFENIRRNEEARLQRHVLQAQRTELSGLEAMMA